MSFTMYMFLFDAVLRVTYTLSLAMCAVGVWRIGSELWRYRKGKF